jgi:class 3 adenylate cyclase
LSMLLVNQFMKNKLNDLSSLTPIPNCSRKYISRILKLLRKPSLAEAIILNIDIVEFSSIVSKYNDNPELLRSILVEFYKLFIDETSKNGGTIGKIMGDGIIAIFGWPNLGKYYQNNNEENLRAAIATSEQLLTASLVISGVPINFRLGMTAGNVYIGHFGNKYRRDYMAIGDAIDISELVQKSADSHSLFICNEVLCLMESSHPNYQTMKRHSTSYKGKDVILYQVIFQ